MTPKTRKLCSSERSLVQSCGGALLSLVKESLFTESQSHHLELFCSLKSVFK